MPGNCENLLFAAEQSIPRGIINNCVPCWDKDCKTPYLFFRRVPARNDSDRAASSVLSQIDHETTEALGKKLSIS